MLSKKDKEDIKFFFTEEFNKAMTRKITVERGPRKQGDLENKTVEEEWNILDWLVGYLPYVEGSLRGVQSDVDKSKNQTITMLQAIEAISNILLSQEEGIKKLVTFSNWVVENQKRLDRGETPLKLE